MQTDELWYGYSDLLTQFKLRTRTPTDIDDLRVMFFIEEDFNNKRTVDLVASENDGEHVMSLAIFNLKRSSWQNEMLPGTRAWAMIKHFCETSEGEDVSSKMNDFFGTYL